MTSAGSSNARPLIDVGRAFLSAQFDQVLDAVGAERGDAAAFLRARTLLRLDRSGEALAASRLAYESCGAADDRAVAAALCALAEMKLGRADQARAWVATGKAQTPSTPYARAEVGYAAAAVAFCAGDYDGGEMDLRMAHACPSPDMRVRALTLEAHVAAARGDLARHAELLSQGLAIPGQRDVYVRASVIYQLSVIARATLETVDVRALERAFAALHWTEPLRLWRYLAGQNLGWYHALDGSYLRAYQYVERAIDDAPSVAWTATSHADYAQFARAAGEELTARLHLDRALEIIDGTDWAALDGEERSVLPEVAALLAESDGDRARAILDRFETLPPLAATYAFSHGARAQAMLDFARGIQAPHDETALGRLESAYDTFVSLGYTWRAATASAALARITQQERWLAIATEALRGYPRSWIARDLLGRSYYLQRRFPGLTAQQLRVLDLLAQGLSDREIATRLEIAYRTARNHVTAVLKRTGVTSRRSLIDAFAST